MPVSKESRVIRRSKRPENLLLNRLKQLLNGRPVELISTYVDVTAREQKLLVLFAPGAMYGMAPNKVVISVIDKGSCVIDIQNGKGLYKLVLAGIPSLLAKPLFHTLKALGELYAKQQNATRESECAEIVLQRKRRHRKNETGTYTVSSRKRSKKAPKG